MNPYLSIPLAVAGFSGFFYFAKRLGDVVAISMSSWDELSKVFPDSRPICPQHDYEEMNMRVGNYELEGLIDIDIIETGLRVYPRFARPPIFINWSQVASIAPGKVIVKYAPPIHLFLPAGAYERIRDFTPHMRFEVADIEALTALIRKLDNA